MEWGEPFREEGAVEERPEQDQVWAGSEDGGHTQNQQEGRGERSGGQEGPECTRPPRHDSSCPGSRWRFGLRETGRPLAAGGGRGPRWLRRLPCGQVNRDRASAQGGSCGAGGLRTGWLIWELPGLGGGWTWRVREEGDR